MKITTKAIIKGLKTPGSALQTVLLITVVAGAYLYRALPYFLNPQLYAEDGVLWLSEGRGLGAHVLLLKPYNGFFHFPERLLGFLVARLPLYWAPAIFAVTAWALFVGMAYYLLTSRTKIFNSTYERIFMALSLCLIANLGEFFFNFSNSVFLIGVLGALILVAAKPKHLVGEITEKVIYTLACFCLPFAWFYVPIALVDRFKFKAKNNFFLAVAAVSSVAQAAGYFLTHTSRSPVTLASLFSKYVMLEIYNQMLIPAVRFARADFPIAEYTSQHYPLWLVSLSLVTTVAVIGIVLRRSNRQVWFVLFFLAGMTFASLKSPTMRLDSAEDVFKTMAVMHDGNRYFVYGIVFLNVIFAKATYMALAPKARYVFLTIFMAFGLISSIHYKSFRIDKNWQDFSSQYHHGVDLYYQGQKEVIIPVNPAPWTMGLFHLDKR